MSDLIVLALAFACTAGLFGIFGLCYGIYFLWRKLSRRWREARQAEKEMGVGQLWPKCKHGTAKHIKCEECRKEAEEFFSFKSQRLEEVSRHIIKTYGFQGSNVTSSYNLFSTNTTASNTRPLYHCAYCNHHVSEHPSSASVTANNFTDTRCRIGGCNCQISF